MGSGFVGFYADLAAGGECEMKLWSDEPNSWVLSERGCPHDEGNEVIDCFIKLLVMKKGDLAIMWYQKESM